MIYLISFEIKARIRSFAKKSKADRYTDLDLQIYEKDRKAKEELIIKLQTQVTELTDKVSNLSVQADEQEQYSRRNCLLIHGVEENRNEDTDTLSINIIKEHLGLDIQPSDIDRTQRIGNKNKARKKGRAIIIKFTRYNIRKKGFHE